MKLNENYILRTVAGSDVVVAVGKEAAKLRGMMNLNDTAAFIWRCLEKGFDEEKIIEKLKEEYAGADDKTLKLEVQTFLDKLIDMGIVQK